MCSVLLLRLRMFPFTSRVFALISWSMIRIAALQYLVILIFWGWCLLIVFSLVRCSDIFLRERESESKVGGGWWAEGENLKKTPC